MANVVQIDVASCTKQLSHATENSMHDIKSGAPNRTELNCMHYKTETNRNKWVRKEIETSLDY